ncbi:hypothetical protein [Nocardia sp. GAS34]
MAESGRLSSRVGAIYPLPQTAEAFRAKAGTTGKIVLDISAV